MPYSSLSTFIQELERRNELVRVREYVDPVLEIAEITDRQSKLPGGGKALLFEHTGTPFPVLTNAYGSVERIAIALGVESLDAIAGDIRTLFSELQKPRGGVREKLALLPTLSKMAGWFPVVTGGRGACQEVVINNPDMEQLPVLKCWPFDGGRFVTLPMVNTKDLETGVRNVGMYRMQVLGAKNTGMHWHKHKVGARHFEQYRKAGRLMPVAVALGGDPAYTYAATAPMPDNMDEYLLAGFLRKKKVRLVKCLTVDLEVPEDVDFVIEGYVDPSDEPVWEGPFGDHTGFYSLADWYPRFHVTCITHRRDAIYPATVVGIPPMEDAYLAKATERIFLEPIRAALLPELSDMVLPVEGTAHNIALVSLSSAYRGQAYKVMSSLWGAGQMMFNKFLFALPDSIDLNDSFAVVRQVLQAIDPENDLLFSKGPLDVLDHSSDGFAFGSKLFVDATGRRDATPVTIDKSDVKRIIAGFSSVLAVNTSLIDRGIPLLVLSVDKRKYPRIGELLERIAAKLHPDGVKVVVVVDMDEQLDDLSLVVWFAAANTDPKRDISLFRSYGNGNAIIGIDATRKGYPDDGFSRSWPNIVTMDDATIKRVDSKWEALGLGSPVESPSKRLCRLNSGDDAVANLAE